MTSRGLPDLQTSPVLVAAGKVTPAIAIDTRAEGKTGQDHDGKESGVIASHHENTAFFRFQSKEAISDDLTRQPSLLIQANQGPEIEISASYPSISGVNDGVNPTDAASVTRFDATDHHGFLIKVWIHIPGLVLKVKIKNNDLADHQFTWAAGGTQAETRAALRPKRQPKTTSATEKPSGRAKKSDNG
jgi:hypothetical protein